MKNIVALARRFWALNFLNDLEIKISLTQTFIKRTRQQSCGYVLSKPCLKSGKRITQPSKIAHNTTKCKYFSDFLRDFWEKVMKQNWSQVEGKKSHRLKLKWSHIILLCCFQHCYYIPIKINLYEIMYFWQLCRKALLSEQPN